MEMSPVNRVKKISVDKTDISCLINQAKSASFTSFLKQESSTNLILNDFLRKKKSFFSDLVNFMKKIL